MPSPSPSWQDRSVFITGCTGLLGSWLSQRLVVDGAHVVGLVRDDVPHSRLIQELVFQHITVIHGDVRDYSLLERTLNEYEVSTVFHLAAQTIVGIANRSPVGTLDTNVRGTWQLLEACRRTSTVQAVIVASSDKAYGTHHHLPYDETFSLHGEHPYDVSKSCADLIANCYAQTYKLPVAITRCGNLYGGGDLNFNRIVPGTIRSILRGQRPIIRSDGTLTRDYIYVEDAVRSYVTLAEHLLVAPDLRGEAFNFSCEQPLSVRQLVEAILEQTGRSDLEPEILGDAPNEIDHQYLSAAKAERLLGWRPAFSLAEGLDRTIAWYRSYLSGSFHSKPTMLSIEWGRS